MKNKAGGDRPGRQEEGNRESQRHLGPRGRPHRFSLGASEAREEMKGLGGD